MYILKSLQYLYLFISYSTASVLFCGYGSWSVYRPLQGRLMGNSIPPDLCTHVAYQYASLIDNKIYPSDYYVDLESDEDVPRIGNYARLNRLKKSNPALKTIIAIGGWNAGGWIFSQMVKNRVSRTLFMQSVVDFTREHGFDGVWMDWQTPGLSNRGGTRSDKENLSRLLIEMREFLATESKKSGKAKLQVVLTVSATPAHIEQYDMKVISNTVDLVVVPTFIMNNFWSDKGTVHPSPIADEDPDIMTLTRATLALRNAGLDLSRTVMGVPTFGNGFVLEDASDADINAPIASLVGQGPISGETGVRNFLEICRAQNVDNDLWVTKRVGETPFTVNGKVWIGYDDERSVKAKAEFSTANGFAGLAMSGLQSDDPNGYCTFPFPLTNTAKKFLGLGSDTPSVPDGKLNKRCLALANTAHVECDAAMTCIDYRQSEFGPNEYKCSTAECYPPLFSECLVDQSVLDFVGSKPFNQLHLQVSRTRSTPLNCAAGETFSDPELPNAYFYCSPDTLGGETIQEWVCPSDSTFVLESKFCISNKSNVKR